MTNPLDQPLETDLSAELQERKAGFGKTTVVLGVSVLAIVAFVGGVFVQKSFGAAETPARQTAAGRVPGGTPPSGAQQRPNGGFGRGTAGTIDHIEGTTVFVKTQNGEIVKVSTSDTTKVEITSAGKLADLKAGQQIVVQGQAGTDGTVSGQTITQRPTTG
ncbi:hypothetical protein ACIA8G_02445 [Lentzea sp. NPDC051213]|uniref:hypothetical protein n=1 Tax=Lentzea sp. NPDC051213 TaxID=3364126 RepID=UPI0037B40DA6